MAGDDITKMNDDQVRQFRMRHVSMVYQDPGAALNPTTKVGPQVVEAFTVLGQSQKQAEASALKALQRVQIADPERVAQRYPHQLSGGMQQRIVIAIALASDPKLLVLDEPTTGLDATVEASVLDLVRSLQAETNAAVLLIAHNLGVIRTLCDRVGVMYAGKIVEEGDAATVFESPKHPYTLGLLRSLPRHGVRKSQRPLSTIPGNLPQIGTPLPTCVFVDRCQLATDLCRTVVPPVVDVGGGGWSRCHHIDRLGELVEPPAVVGRETVHGDEALSVSQVSKTFHQSGHDVPALVKVDLNLFDGETLGLVGESGSGKSTLAKTILGIESPDAGQQPGVRRPCPRGAVVRPADRGQARPPDGLPEPRLGAQPRLDRPGHPRPLGQQADRAQGQGRQRAGRQAGRRPPPDPAPPRPQAAAAVGRAQAARGDRAGVRGRPPDRRGRRADERARRLGPGRDPQPAVRAPAQEQDELPADLARSRGRPLPRRPDRGDVPRPDHGGRRVGDGLQRAEPPLHRGAALGGPERGRRGTRPDPARGRDPESGQPAVGLRLQHPLPPRHPRAVRGRRAAAGRGRAGTPDELPHPARGAAPAPEAGGRDGRDARDAAGGRVGRGRRRGRGCRLATDAAEPTTDRRSRRAEDPTPGSTGTPPTPA